MALDVMATPGPNQKSTTRRAVAISNNLSTPDVTAAQILALVTGVIALLVAFAVVDKTRSQELIAAFGIIVPAAVALADSIIRSGRSKAVAALHQKRLGE